MTEDSKKNSKRFSQGGSESEDRAAEDVEKKSFVAPTSEEDPRDGGEE